MAVVPVPNCKAHAMQTFRAAGRVLPVRRGCAQSCRSRAAGCRVPAAVRRRDKICKAIAAAGLQPDLPAQSSEIESFSSVNDALKTLSQLRRTIAASAQSSDINEEAQTALQQWAEAAEAVIPQVTTRQAAGILGVLSTLHRQGLVPPESLTETAVASYVIRLLERFQDGLSQFAKDEIIYVVTGAALLCPAIVSEDLLCELEVVLFPLLPSLSGADLAACMWALGRITGEREWAPDDVWLEQFLQATLVLLPSLSNADLAAVLSSLARFECRPAQPWLDALFISLKTRTESMSAGELQLLKYSCMELGVAVEVP